MTTFSIDDPNRGDKFIGTDNPRVTGKLKRPVSQAFEELENLLAGDVETNRDKIQAVVTEIEQFHAVVDRNFGSAPQHEGDAAGTMHSIREALSDIRLRAMGIVSDLAFEEKEEECAL